MIAKKPQKKTKSPRAVTTRSSYGTRPADRAYEAQIRQLEIERLRELLETERRRAIAEREERQRLMSQQLDRETNWRRLMQKASLASKVGKFGAGWTWEDDAWSDRLGVELGYLKPWDRKYTVKVGAR
jgi:hypothetical protein